MPAHGELTTREKQILELIARGGTDMLIAEQLGISRRTVSRHVSDLLVRLGAQTRSEAVAMALKGGLLALSDD